MSRRRGGAGIMGNGTLATIQNSTVMGNSAADYGGGLSGCRGTIQNSTIAGNWAGHPGGGLSACDGIIQNNTITGNSAPQGVGCLDPAALSRTT